MTKLTAILVPASYYLELQLVELSSLSFLDNHCSLWALQDLCWCLRKASIRCVSL